MLVFWPADRFPARPLPLSGSAGLQMYGILFSADNAEKMRAFYTRFSEITKVMCPLSLPQLLGLITDFWWRYVLHVPECVEASKAVVLQ